MDFFAAQEAAKKRTAWAVALFAVGVAATALAVYWVSVWGLIMVSPKLLLGAREVIYDTEFWTYPWSFIWERPQFFWTAIGSVTVVILGASAYKISSLGEGGLSVAQSVGARIVDLNTTDAKERRLMNVVEEMAIASGVQVPMVGVLDDEAGVNAFAAMKTPRDAVVVVTRGALESFTRDELQAVVGHEFSHLLNGDSKMNVTLAGWVWGLFFLTIVGRLLMQSQRHSDSRRKGGGVVIVGLAIFIVGLIGHLVGQMIQALISRQREFLADASSVQFTRNPGAMLSTLNKLRAGTAIKNPSGSGMAHFFFAPAHAFNGFTGLLATHPPVEARMKAIDENYESVLMTEPAEAETPAAAGSAAPERLQPMTLVGVLAGAGSVGVAQSVPELIGEWPAQIKDALGSSDGARAALLSLAVPLEKCKECMAHLEEKVTPGVWRLMYELETSIQKISAKERFALAQLALPRAQLRGDVERVGFLCALETIVELDGELTNFEVFYTEWLRHALKKSDTRTKFPPSEAASRVLSYLYGHQKTPAPITDEEMGRILSGLALKDLRAIRNVTTRALHEALPGLRGYDFLQRRELLIAAGRVLHLDNVLTDEEAETLRLLAGIVECPLPARWTQGAV